MATISIAALKRKSLDGHAAYPLQYYNDIHRWAAYPSQHHSDNPKIAQYSIYCDIIDSNYQWNPFYRLPEFAVIFIAVERIAFFHSTIIIIVSQRIIFKHLSNYKICHTVFCFPKLYEFSCRKIKLKPPILVEVLNFSVEVVTHLC